MKNKNRIYACAVALLIAVADAPAVTPWMQSVPAGDWGSPWIAIVSPGNDTTVFDNEGTVPVHIDLSPALRNDAATHIELLLDGIQVEHKDGEFILTGVERGEHLLQARVVDANDNTLVESEPIKFYMWQASRLFPGRR